MPAPCISSTLDTAINGVCVSQVVGIEPVAVLLAASNVDRSTLSYEAGTVIVDNLATIGAATGQIITVKGDLPYAETNVAGTMGTYVQLFESTFAFPIHENSPASAKQVMQLGNDHYLAIVQFKGYDPAKKNKYGIIGLNRGLQFATSALSFASQEEFGYRIELKEMEGLVPLHFFWDTDEATTDLWFESLKP